MSDVRRERSEIVTSLHQHAMHYHHKLLETNSPENAKEIVIEALNSVTSVFGEDTKASTIYEQELDRRQSMISQLLTEETDFDSTLEIENVLSAITTLKNTYLFKEENNNG